MCGWVCGCRGPTVCIVLRHFIRETWASEDFCICGGPKTNPSWIPRDNWSLGESEVIHKFLTGGRGQPLTPVLFKGQLHTGKSCFDSSLANLSPYHAPRYNKETKRPLNKSLWIVQGSVLFPGLRASFLRRFGLLWSWADLKVDQSQDALWNLGTKDNDRGSFSLKWAQLKPPISSHHQ